MKPEWRHRRCDEFSFIEKYPKLGSSERTSNNSIRIFIYPTSNYHGSKYADEVTLCGKKQDLGMYDAEQYLPSVLIHLSRVGINRFNISNPNLLKANEGLEVVITEDPGDEVDFFLVPHHAVCLLHSVQHKFHHGHINSAGDDVSIHYMVPLLNYVAEKFPYFKSKNGSDHIYLFTQDRSIGYFSQEVKMLINNSIILSSFGIEDVTYSPNDWNTSAAKWYRYNRFHSTSLNVYHPSKDIVIPPYSDIPIKSTPFLKYNERKVLGVFVGTIKSNTGYSGGTRQALQRANHSSIKADTSSHLLIIPHHLEKSEYWQTIEDAKFMLCPAGSAPWSPRYFDSLFRKSVPVVIADGTIPLKIYSTLTSFSFFCAKNVHGYLFYVQESYFRSETFSIILFSPSESI